MPKIFNNPIPNAELPDTPKSPSQKAEGLGPLNKKIKLGSADQGSDRYKKNLQEFKAKHNEDIKKPKEASVFKQGLAKHDPSIEKKALRAYQEVTGKSYAEVQANKGKILEKLGMKGKSWHRKSKIEQEIATAKKQMPYMESWKRKELGKILKTKKKIFGLGPTGKKRGWF